MSEFLGILLFIWFLFSGLFGSLFILMITNSPDYCDSGARRILDITKTLFEGTNLFGKTLGILIFIFLLPAFVLLIAVDIIFLLLLLLKIIWELGRKK